MGQHNHIKKRQKNERKKKYFPLPNMELKIHAIINQDYILIKTN